MNTNFKIFAVTYLSAALFLSVAAIADSAKENSKHNARDLHTSNLTADQQKNERAAFICKQWGIDHTVIDIQCLNEITENSLTRHSMEILHPEGKPPNSLVVGRNGLMAHISAIHANQLGANVIYMGVIEIEAANSGYRDCSRKYMDMIQEVLRIDLDDPSFEIRTPLVKMTKRETMEFGHRLGVLEFLLENTISCYQGIEKLGCGKCPACKLRNEGISQFLNTHPDFQFSYRSEIL